MGNIELGSLKALFEFRSKTMKNGKHKATAVYTDQFGSFEKYFIANTETEVYFRASEWLKQYQ